MFKWIKYFNKTMILKETFIKSNVSATTNDLKII